MSFTSSKYWLDERIVHLEPGIQCFQIYGKLYHVHDIWISYPLILHNFVSYFFIIHALNLIQDIKIMEIYIKIYYKSWQLYWIISI